ncbi:MAG: hypothetical protein LBU34_02035 [Planctomycetaceae bacterium]|nr:hypothetical protein [Planctomycetaceae bacterium]
MLADNEFVQGWLFQLPIGKQPFGEGLPTFCLSDLEQKNEVIRLVLGKLFATKIILFGNKVENKVLWKLSTE